MIDQSERVAVQCIAERTSQQRHVGAIYQVVDGLTSANRSGETRVVEENDVTTKQTLLERQEPSDQARNSRENGEICPETPMPRIHRHNAASHRTGSEETASASRSSANDVRMFHSGHGQSSIKRDCD